MEIQTLVRTDGPVPVTVLQIRGTIDTISFTDLEKKGEQIYKEGARRVVLDLTDVDHISSAGLRSIHTIFNLLRSNYPAEGDAVLAQKIAGQNFKSRLLKLVRPNANVLQVLRTSGYNLFLEVHNDLDTAIQSF